VLYIYEKKGKGGMNFTQFLLGLEIFVFFSTPKKILPLSPHIYLDILKNITTYFSRVVVRELKNAFLVHFSRILKQMCLHFHQSSQFIYKAMYGYLYFC
jgi:hypothetical protein